MMLIKQIEQQTQFSLQKRKSLINFFNKQNLEIQVDIFKEQRNQFFVLKNKYDLSDITALAAFYKAIDNFYNKETILKQKNKSTSLDELKNISDFAIKKNRKQKISDKREKLLNLISVISNLLDESYSYRQISQYLRKVHRFEVSHTYVKKIYEEVHNV